MRVPPSPQALAWSWQRLAALVAGLGLVIAPAAGWLGRGAWRAACRQVRLAEALARRLLICRAGELGFVPAPARCKVPAAQPAPLPQSETAPPQAVFALVDRLGGLSGTGFAGVPAGLGASDAGEVSIAGLARRLAGLQAVLADPEPYARRLARRLFGSGGSNRRTSPLRPGAPPGRRRGGIVLDQDALDLAHFGALDVLNSPP